MKIGVILSGCGVFDGSELHEAVLTLYYIKKMGMIYECLAPNIEQLHVINHSNGKEMSEKRNVLVESGRIARGEIHDISTYNLAQLDAAIFPGGFGTAKNHTNWALMGAKSQINGDIKKLIEYFLKNKKPLVGICMGPTTIAKGAQDLGLNLTLSVGSILSPSPYDIKGIADELKSIGVNVVNKEASEIAVDETNKVISAPTYMMETDIVGVALGVENAISALKQLLSKN